MNSLYLEDDDFARTIFYGILIYVLRGKAGATQHWRNETVFSIELGTSQYPLFKFCYDYLTMHKLNLDSIEDAVDALRELRMFDRNKSNSDEDIITISNFHIHSEAEVRNALINIEDKLRNSPNTISYYMYGTIAVYSIMISELLSYDISGIKSLLVSNLNGIGSKIRTEQIFRITMPDNSSKKSKSEFIRLKEKMTDAVFCGSGIIPDFEYLPSQANYFCSYIIENENAFYSRGAFASDIDIEKIAQMFFDSTPEQKDQIRGAFLTLYRTGNAKSLLPHDIDYIVRLNKLIKTQRSGTVGDKIQELQYDYFISNLEDIIKNLS